MYKWWRSEEVQSQSCNFSLAYYCGYSSDTDQLVLIRVLTIVLSWFMGRKNVYFFYFFFYFSKYIWSKWTWHINEHVLLIKIGRRNVSLSLLPITRLSSTVFSVYQFFLRCDLWDLSHISFLSHLQTFSQMRHVHCAIFLNFHFFLIYKLFLPRCDLNAGERNYNVCFYMFSFMMVRNEIIKWQWNNIFQSKSRFAPCWWPPRSSSATSVPSRFTLLLYKPQFFRDQRLKYQLK